MIRVPPTDPPYSGGAFQVDDLSFDSVEIVLQRAAWRDLNKVPGFFSAKASIDKPLMAPDSRQKLFDKLSKLEALLTTDSYNHPVVAYITSPWDASKVYSGFCIAMRSASLKMDRSLSPVVLNLEFDLRAMKLMTKPAYPDSDSPPSTSRENENGN